MSTTLSYILYFFSAYLLLTLILFLLSYRGSTSASFFARLLASYLALTVITSYGVFVSIFLRLVGLGRSSQWAAGRAFAWMMAWAVGVRFVVEGKEVLKGTRPAVFVGNHQSELDVLMLGTIFPKHCAVTAKKSLRHIPILGWFMALSGTVFIDRTNRRTAVAAFDGAAAEMQKYRQSVFIFAEGTRSYFDKPDLLPFKKGAFHLAIQAKVPIVPVVVANYSYVLNVSKWIFKSGTIPIKVLPPIPTAHLTASDVEELTRTTRELMLKEIVNLAEKGLRESDGAAVGQKAANAVDSSGVAEVSGADAMRGRGL
ncbi:MAG: 1-acylglycerol-3-phosphate O-acyltransferase [Geoglossum umbratile]|nr:MAG: 1-acylglycerol-3-phosphate O-acyltransferase [Geoglossum umbratile]